MDERRRRVDGSLAIGRPTISVMTGNTCLTPLVVILLSLMHGVLSLAQLRSLGGFKRRRLGTFHRSLETRLMSTSQSQVVETFLHQVLPKAWRSTGMMELLRESKDFSTYFQKLMNEYADGVSKEIEFYRNVSNKPDSRLLQEYLTEYEDQRAVSSGVVPCLALGHFLLDQPNTSLYPSPAFDELLRLASLISGIDNDISSFQKDGDSWDFLSLHIRVGGKSLDEAIDLACQRHDEVVLGYQAQGKALVDDWPGDPSTQMWVETICPSVMRGFVSWQCYVKRYKADTTRFTAEQLLLRLFPSQPYRVVNERGEFEGMDKDLRSVLTDEVGQWATQCGLTAGSNTLLPQKKLDAIDPVLCSLLLFDHYSRGKSESESFLRVFAKFFCLLILVDDLLENPSIHSEVKVALFKCVDEL